MNEEFANFINNDLAFCSQKKVSGVWTAQSTLDEETSTATSSTDDYDDYIFDNNNTTNNNTGSSSKVSLTT